MRSGWRRALATLAAGVVIVVMLASSADAKAWAWLGVRIRDLSEQEMDELSTRHGIREGFGVVIVEVIDGTAAARAGLRNGDIVVALGGRPVTETRLLQRLIAAAPTDRDVRLTVLRPDGREQVQVRLTSMPREVAGDRVAAEYGFALRSSPGPPGSQMPEEGSIIPTVGVVLRGGSAERAGLKVGDIILQVGDVGVVTTEAARDVLADFPLDRPLSLAVRRGERRMAVTLSAP